MILKFLKKFNKMSDKTYKMSDKTYIIIIKCKKHTINILYLHGKKYLIIFFFVKNSDLIIAFKDTYNISDLIEYYLFYNLIFEYKIYK
jgi:hypothetical protein